MVHGFDLGTFERQRQVNLCKIQNSRGYMRSSLIRLKMLMILFPVGTGRIGETGSLQHDKPLDIPN